MNPALGRSKAPTNPWANKARGPGSRPPGTGSGILRPNPQSATNRPSSRVAKARPTPKNLPVLRRTGRPVAPPINKGPATARFPHVKKDEGKTKPPGSGSGIRRPSSRLGPTQRLHKKTGLHPKRGNPTGAMRNLTGRLHELEREVKALKDEKTKLLSALKDREQALAEKDKRYKQNLTARMEAFETTSQSLTKQVQEQNEDVVKLNVEKDNLSKEVLKLKAQTMKFSRENRRLKTELTENVDRLKNAESNYENQLKEKLGELVDKRQQRLERQKKVWDKERAELNSRIEDWKAKHDKVQTKLEASLKQATAFEEQIEKLNAIIGGLQNDHKDKVAQARRTSQSTIRSAVSNAEKRGRESLAHYQEQCRVLESELRTLKAEYEKKIKKEREDYLRQSGKIADDVGRLKRDMTLAQNEASQLRKLWRETERVKTEQEQRIEQLLAELESLKDTRTISISQPKPINAGLTDAQLDDLATTKIEKTSSDSQAPSLSSLQNEIQTARTQYIEQQKSLDASAKQVDQFKQRISELEELHRHTDSRLQDFEKLESERDLWKTNAHTAGQKLKDAEIELETLQKSFESSQEQLSEAQHNLYLAQKELADSRDEVEKTQTLTVEPLQQQLEKLQQHTRQQQQELQRKDKQLKALWDEQSQQRIELQTVKRDFEERRTREAKRTLDSLQNAIEIARVNYGQAQTARDQALAALQEAQKTKAESDAISDAQTDADSGADTAAAAEHLGTAKTRRYPAETIIFKAPVFDELIHEDQDAANIPEDQQAMPAAGVEALHRTASESEGPTDEENERLRKIIEELKTRLSRAEQQLEDMSSSAAEEKDSFERALAEQRQRNEALASTVETWTEQQTKKREIHRCFEKPQVVMSSQRHDAEHMLFVPETLLLLCRNLDEYLHYGDIEGEASGQPRKRGNLGTMLSTAQASQQLIALEVRLEELQESCHDRNRAMASLKELNGLLTQERRRIDHVHGLRGEYLQKLEHGSKDVRMLARLAAMALTDRRIHSEIFRVTVAVDAIDYALRRL